MRSKSAVAERVLGPYLSHVGMGSTLADLAGHFFSVLRRVSNGSRGYGKCLEPKAGLAPRVNLVTNIIIVSAV